MGRRSLPPPQLTLRARKSAPNFSRIAATGTLLPLASTFYELNSSSMTYEPHEGFAME